jgi:hypothetical protein
MMKTEAASNKTSGNSLPSISLFIQDLRKRGFQSPLPRERARVRGLKKAFSLIDPLIPTFSRREKEQNS